jgi:ribosomal protein S18 acetylase RimI-like enzyme
MNMTIKKYINPEGEITYRLDYRGEGYLDFQVVDGVAFLIYVEVKKDFRNLGIATKLLSRFFQIISKKGYFFDMSEYLPDGKLYLKSKIENYIKQFNITTL